VFSNPSHITGPLGKS
jgi:hypothetical protein